MNLYEFKIRIDGDDRDWSEIGLYALRPGQAADAAAYAQQVARYEKIREVRYNVRGTDHHVSVITDDEKIHPTDAGDNSMFCYFNMYYYNMDEIAEDMLFFGTAPDRFRDLADELATRRGLSLR